MLYHWDKVHHEEWSEGFTLWAAERPCETNNLRQVAVVVLPGFDGAVAGGEELETGGEGTGAGAVIKEMVTKRDIWQERGQVVDLLNRKSHDLKQIIASQEERFSVMTVRDVDR